jgi:hypothetical protein
MRNISNSMKKDTQQIPKEMIKMLELPEEYFKAAILKCFNW